VADVLVRGQGQNAHLTVFGGDTFDGFNAADSGHRDVHHQDVREVRLAGLTRGFTTVGFSHDFNVITSLKQEPESHTHYSMIIDQQDS
jgi:hypothetical protein